MSATAGDVAQLLERALDALIDRCEKRKFGGSRAAVSRIRRSFPSLGTGKALEGAKPLRPSPRPARRVGARPGQCTFLSAAGRRCAARRFLEFDHVEPVARGGRATIEGMRLRCRAHNQYEAERVFGAGFMDRKRHEARLAAHEHSARGRKEEAAARDASARERALSKQQAQEVLAGLRSLGCRSDEARRAIAYTEALHGVTFEERLRAALKFVSRRSIRGHIPACERETAFRLEGRKIPARGIVPSKLGLRSVRSVRRRMETAAHWIP